MSANSIYADIARRTGGDIYIGVVGPVRSGKSTFIRKFLDSAVLPNIDNQYDRERTLDEIPQSASGRTVMTTEPKFVPDESVRISLGNDAELNVKMVDCVGYMVEGALGAEEDGEARMVMTPWSDEEMPFITAAELGTSKVIGEHATIAMLVTTDGSITGIERENYLPAEERVVKELWDAGKPFCIILNSKEPESESAHALAIELEKRYSAPVALVSCAELNAEDIKEILGLVLGEFPIKTLSFTLPDWLSALPEDHKLRGEIISRVEGFADEVSRFSDVSDEAAEKYGFTRVSLDAGTGEATLDVPISREVFFESLCLECGMKIGSDRELFIAMMSLSKIKKEYEKIESALSDVREKGYGIVLPSAEELVLEEPKLVHSQGGYGVRVTARADSIHMIKAGIKADLCPVIGSEEQSEEVIKFLSEEFKENPEGVWDYNMFGKSLYDMVNDGMSAKLSHIPDESREKLGETLGKIVNEGSNGLICILL